MPSSIGLASFEPLVGQVFQAQRNGVACQLCLVEAQSLKAFRNAPRQDPFSLVFRGTTSIGQGPVVLQHGELDPLEVFLVPIGTDQQGELYEAVFN